MSVEPDPNLQLPTDKNKEQAKDNALLHGLSAVTQLCLVINATVESIEIA